MYTKVDIKNLFTQNDRTVYDDFDRTTLYDTGMLVWMVTRQHSLFYDPYHQHFVANVGGLYTRIAHRCYEVEYSYSRPLGMIGAYPRGKTGLMNVAVTSRLLDEYAINVS